jgi:hypothetical protein
MLMDGNIPFELWHEIIRTAVHILYCITPTNKITPLQIVKNQEKCHDLSYFRRTGSSCQFMSTVGPQDKLTTRTSNGFLLGYGLGTKSYRIYNPQKDLVEESRDISFNENEVFPDSDKWDSSEIFSNVDNSSETPLEKHSYPGEHEVFKVYEERYIKKDTCTRYFGMMNPNTNGFHTLTLNTWILSNSSKKLL